MANILIAADAPGSGRLRHILESDYHVQCVETRAEANKYLASCDLLICGLEFDESHMFDFIRQIDRALLKKLNPLCVRFIATNTPDPVIGGLRLAVQAAGARELIDLPALDLELGSHGANERVKEIVAAALGDKGKH